MSTHIFVAKETHPGETRVPLLPEGVTRLVGKGAVVAVQAGIGASVGVDDRAYRDAGATISKRPAEALAKADMVLRLHKPPAAEVKKLRKGGIHVSYLDPFNEGPLLNALAKRGVTAISMEMIPRTTLAQKMDALSSQASLAGYEAVIVAAAQLNKVLPMMMTPAGTLAPSRVFVIGAGVAGLQAIATAKRLGARVEAFDTRPVVEEQVQSLGARFLKVDLGDTGQTEGGYAKELTKKQLELQRQAMAKACAQADIVITTAQVFGRPAPRIITKEMVAGMQPNSVVVDLAVETGGNVEGSQVDKVVTVNGVKIVGYGNMPGRLAAHASQMYSSNLVNLVEHGWDSESSEFKLDLEDEIFAGCVLTHEGEIRDERFKSKGRAKSKTKRASAKKKTPKKKSATKKKAVKKKSAAKKKKTAAKKKPTTKKRAARKKAAKKR